MNIIYGMKNNKKRIEELLEKYNNGILTDSEVDELALLVQKEEIKDFNRFHDDADEYLINNL